jgi:coenzyme F420-reducing hydrogenase delta subunit
MGGWRSRLDTASEKEGLLKDEQVSKGNDFEPKIAAFLCRWCSYAGADLAGSSRRKYPSGIRIIRVPCSCRIDPKLVIKSLERGVDGVLVSGCHPGDCHYTSGNYYARRRLMMLGELLEFLGIDSRRFQMSWVSASEGDRWAQVVSEVTEDIKRIGPSPHFQNGADEFEAGTG